MAIITQTAFEQIRKQQEPKKPVNVQFRSDFDITELLTLYGNWARKDIYLKSGSVNIFKSQKNEWKECLNDDDAMIISGCFLALKSIKNQKAKDEYAVLNYYYYGKDEMIDGVPMIIPQSTRCISKIMNISETRVRDIKGNGENFIVGHLSAITQLTGQKLDILDRIRFL